MIDLSDWQHGLEVLKQAIYEGDSTQIQDCLDIFSRDIESALKEEYEQE